MRALPPLHLSWNPGSALRMLDSFGQFAILNSLSSLSLHLKKIKQHQQQSKLLKTENISPTPINFFC